MDMLISILASRVPESAPDTGATVLLLGIAVIGLGAIARFTKKNKK
ncbi:MAG: hypothetical protein ACI92G_001089 [Candidatus Pelagisphaera sp.]|jgi:hypothetical protein